MGRRGMRRGEVIASPEVVDGPAAGPEIPLDRTFKS